MKEISLSAMSEINGGGAGWLIASIVAGVTFIIGIFSGYTNPNKCNN